MTTTREHAETRRDCLSDPRPEAALPVPGHVLREGDSLTGRRVRLSLEQNQYTGAQPYFVVAYDLAFHPGRTKPVIRIVRYTPSLRRAEFLFESFLEDVTEPRALAERPMLSFDPLRDVVRWAELLLSPSFEVPA